MTLDLVDCAELMSLWRSMDANRVEYPEADYQADASIPTPQKSLYDNTSLYASMLTIQERWYSTKCPDSFIIYRATNWKPAVESVLLAWRRRLLSFRVPHIGLSSWSLLRGDDQIPGALHHLAQHRNGVLIQAEVSFENTFMDVMVDDGIFARYGLGESEIIVGYGRHETEIIGNAQKCALRLDGKDYGFRERHQAERTAKKLGFLV